MAGDAPTVSDGTVARAIRVLRSVVDAERPVTAAYVARDTGLAASSAYRMLHLLASEGMITEDETSHLFSPGLEFYRLGSRISARFDLVDVARPHVLEAGQRSGESTALSMFIPDSQKMMFVARVEAAHPLDFRLPMHTPLSLAWGATGRSMLAWLPFDEANRIVATAGRSPASREDPPDDEQLQEELLVVRERGYAVAFGQTLSSAVGVASAIFNARGGLLGAVTITVPDPRWHADREEALGAAVQSAARNISRAVGWSRQSTVLHQSR